jgi:ABC-2 type transport system ATP-binding protein
VLEEVRLASVADRKVKTFSTGMRQRLLLARALLNYPRVLFLDEPTRSLDPRSARELHDTVEALAADGATIFLTTHDMTEADALCRRVAFLADGKVVALDTPRALKLGLSQGAPEVDVVLDDGAELAVRLDAPADAARLQALFGAGRVRSIHSHEPTLAEVFIRLTGRTLTDPVDEEVLP